MPPKRNAKAPGPAPDALSPARFESELKTLADKAQRRSWAHETSERLAPYATSLALLTLAGLASNASQMALSPIYGSLPSAIWHSTLTAAACFVGWAGSLFLERLPVRPLTLVPLVAAWAPVVQFFLGEYSGVLTARWGPLAVEALTLFPLLVLTASCVASSLEGVRLGSLPSFVGDSAPGLGSLLYFKLAEGISGNLLTQHAGRAVFLTRVGLQMLLAGLYAALAPSKLLLLLALPAALHTALLNHHLPTPRATAALQTALGEQGWTLLDRRESVTGYISVLESATQGFRVLRADHSLLGGEWVKLPSPVVAEPVYSVFVMLEAVRLVEGPEPIVDSEANALVIGLGVGTTPAAFISHGIDTTIVEIDPAVHEFASRYFQLPPDHTAVIDDAVGYTRGLAETDQRFDYIVHDVFTGGAEPLPLFTLEFLQGLSTLLKPDGVIAINYAGDILLPTPKMVIQTILHVFPSCRIFRESEPPAEEEVRSSGQDFTNVVIFCKKSGGPLTFRDPVPDDFLRSRARNLFLVPRHEVTIGDFKAEEEGLLRGNGTGVLEAGQGASAVGHWEVMRTVIPDGVWELW